MFRGGILVAGRGGGGEAAMFLKRLQRRKNGKRHTYWALVESVRTADGRPGKTLRLRCVTSPDEGQKVLLSRLGLTLPQRLRRIDEVAQM